MTDSEYEKTIQTKTTIANPKMVGFTSAEVAPFEQLMLKDDNSPKNKACYQSYRMFQNYYFKSQYNQLMLRKIDYTKTLVLARIEIRHKRCGYATKILQALEDLAYQLGYQHVKIESILTDEMHAVARKLHYQEQNYDAIKDIGTQYHGYHGSDNLFIVPKLHMPEQNGHDGGFGFYVTRDYKLANCYGKYLYSCDLYCKRGLSDTINTFDPAELLDLFAWLKANDCDYLENYADVTEPGVWQQTAKAVSKTLMLENDLDLINDIYHAIGDYAVLITWLCNHNITHGYYENSLIVYDLNIIHNWKNITKGGIENASRN